MLFWRYVWHHFVAMKGPPSQRCGQRLGGARDADVLSGDSVLGQAAIRSWRAILGQVILSVGGVFLQLPITSARLGVLANGCFAPTAIVTVTTMTTHGDPSPSTHRL